MCRTFPALAVIVLPLSLTVAAAAAADRAAGWPQWRGPAGTGAAPDADPPTEWSESRNIRWKVPIPGRGHSSPIVWGDRVFVQTAVPLDGPAPESRPAADTPPAGDAPPTSGPVGQRGRDGGGPAARKHRFALLALERRTGQVAWERTLCEAVPHERGHATASLASNSPVTDGEVLIAYFGSRGVYALDLDGRVLWEKQLGEMRTRNAFGEGSSPALFGDTVVITWDHEGPSFIVALDKRTGRERWRADRDEVTSWATPVIAVVDGRPQVIAAATQRVRGYDLASGEVVWECGGLTANVIPTPIVDRGIAYCTSGFRGSALLAVRLADARGDITGTPAVLWSYDGKGTPYVPSAALLGDELYFLQENRAVLSCVDARTGRAHYAAQRLEGLKDVYASVVAAADRVYVASREGKTAVVRRGPEFRVLATNTLDEGVSASPAIVAGELYLRGEGHLYCIAAD